MSIPFTEEGDDEVVEEFQPPPTHNPPAPLHEVFDITTTVDPSYVISLIRKLLPSDEKQKTEGLEENTTRVRGNGGEDEAMESVQVDGTEEIENQSESKSGEETWEECGCVLWDLSASEEHAQFMVQNLILEVLMANLTLSQSSRTTEISLGIIGNLACHETSRKQIVVINGLVKVIVDQLLVDDVPCLCEAFRVVTLCLPGGDGVIWADALKSEQVLSRILWVVENALNPLLIERSVGLILGVLESQQEVSSILLPHMMKLDLPNLLVNLVTFEMRKFREEQNPERYTLLDLILRTIEALSVIDNYSQEICVNKELLQMLKELIKLQDKIEVASSCVTASVLIANILADSSDWAIELSQDLNLLQGLFDVYPLASDDTEAQTAIWSTIGRLLKFIKESDMDTSNLHLLVSILASKSDLVEEELLIPHMDHGEQKNSSSYGTRVDATSIIISRISDILTVWKYLDDGIKSAISMGDNYLNEEDVDNLLNHCQKAYSVLLNGG